MERGGEAESEGGFLDVPSTIHLPASPPDGAGCFTSPRVLPLT